MYASRKHLIHTLDFSYQQNHLEHQPSSSSLHYLHNTAVGQLSATLYY